VKNVYRIGVCYRLRKEEVNIMFIVQARESIGKPWFVIKTKEKEEDAITIRDLYRKMKCWKDVIVVEDSSWNVSN
jgi:hypothetical protein